VQTLADLLDQFQEWRDNLPSSLANSATTEAPSVPMMMRHRPPGNLDLRALKDHLAHARSSHADRRCGWRRHHERRP